MTDSPAIVIAQIAGNCPVQGEGTIDGVPFYFRARGQHWSITIGPEASILKGWFYREKWPQGDLMAGWMGDEDAGSCIAKGAAVWIAAGKPDDGFLYVVPK